MCICLRLRTLLHTTSEAIGSRRRTESAVLADRVVALGPQDAFDPETFEDHISRVVERREVPEVDVHVVSDLREALTGAVVTATVRWPGGDHAWTWAGDVPADAVVRVGTVSVVVPDEAGELAVELALAAPATLAANRDSAVITPTSWA